MHDTLTNSPTVALQIGLYTFYLYTSHHNSLCLLSWHSYFRQRIHVFSGQLD